VCYVNGRTRLTDIPDGTSNTLLAGERSFNDPGVRAIGISETTIAAHYSLWRAGWFPPLSVIRVPFDQINYRIPTNPPPTGAAMNQAFGKRLHGYSSDHPGGATLVFGDGSVRFLRESLPLLTLQAMATRAGGELFTEN
jgi:prepilin-type processing-associated H-X9-DG protein